MTDIIKILGRMPVDCLTDEDMGRLFERYNQECRKNVNLATLNLVMGAYNLGVIKGKRSERMKRKTRLVTEGTK